MPAKPKRVLMSNVDKAWLEMDSETNLMIINGIMLFEEKLDFEKFKRILNDRFVQKYERFRQRVVEGPGGRLYWEDDPYFDIRAHVRRYALPQPANIATLQSVVSSIINEPLDRRKPLWRYLLIENVEGGSAILSRMHHCIADGMALVKVLLDMAGPSAEESMHAVQVAAPQRTAAGPLRTLAGLAKGAVMGSFSIAKTVASETVLTIENPGHPLDWARSAGIMSAAGAAVLAKLLILPPDRRSVFKGDLSVMKRVVWSKPLELPRVKAIGTGLGATINDVLVAAVAGALRNYMIQAGDNPTHGDINAMVPVNLRPEHDKQELGNEFALVFLSLPVSEADPYDRLMLTKHHMDVLKGSPEPYLVYQILGVIGSLPLDLAKQATSWFSAKATAVLTNVPGPRHQIYFAGKPLKSIMFWVPQSGAIGLGISIISYNGMVTLGIMTDDHLVSDPQAIIDGFEHELVVLEERVLSTHTASNSAPVTDGAPPASAVEHTKLYASKAE